MLKLEIGAGSKPQAGFIHHDIRPLPDIEVVCDARNFPPEEKNKYDYVYASNILEHFNRFEVRKVLQEWVSLLKIGGQIEIIVPDIKEICRQYVMGMIKHEFFVYLCYGGQDYEFNRHYYGFDVDALAALFESVNVKPIKSVPGVVWENRKVDVYCPMVRMIGERLR